MKMILLYSLKKWNFLFDYNEELTRLLLKLLKINSPIKYTDRFEKTYLDLADYRDSIHPKHNSPEQFKTYFQVFEERNSFFPNLSIVDLLFNQGPQSLKYL